MTPSQIQARLLALDTQLHALAAAVAELPPPAQEIVAQKFGRTLHDMLLKLVDPAPTAAYLRTLATVIDGNTKRPSVN